MKLLIIEQDKDICDSLVMALNAELDIDVYCVTTAVEAREMLRKSFDLVMLDYITFVNLKLECKDFHNNALVVTVTAQGQEKKYRGPTYLKVIQKPFELTELIDVIKKMKH